MIKKRLVQLLALLLVVICASPSIKAQEILYSVLKLDFNSTHNNDAVETEPNFNAFIIADSGREVDGIKITIESVNMDARRRGAPTGVPYEQIYRDFIFFRHFRPGTVMAYPYTGATEPATVTLSGLIPNQDYEITIYSFDTSSGGIRYANWTANGEFLFQTVMSQANVPTTEDTQAFREWTKADSTGKIVLVATIADEQLADSAQFNQPFGFLNALTVYARIPRFMALRPAPAIGATITTAAVQLQWQPGGDAVKHNVYIGETFADVDTATLANTNVFRSTVTTSSFDLAGLSPGKTYSWRIDEVKADGAVTKGYVWNFFVASLTAYNPSPVDTSKFADPNATLRWTAGSGATSHRVYFGDNQQNVQTGAGGTDRGAVTTTSFATGMLQRGKTYYWRVDEIAGTTTRAGTAWSFTTSPEGLGTIACDIWEGIAGSALIELTGNPNYPDNPARSETLTSFSYGTADGVGSNYGAQIYGWLYVPLTGSYTFWFTSADEGELWLSTDDDPDNVQLLAAERTWGNFNVFSHKADPIPLIGGNKYYIMARWKEGADWDHCQAAWQGPGIQVYGSTNPYEIIAGNYLSPYEPTSATAPRPRDGSIDVSQKPTLSWKSGEYAASHNVYFGSDPNTISKVATNPVGQELYGPITPALDPNKAYYWRIDEVNNVRTGSPWVGKVWSFTTAAYLVVDDFEYYDDVNNLIYKTWSDYSVNNTGMTVGHLDPPYAETTTVHSGSKAMYLRYDNDGTVNEGTSLEQSGTKFYAEADREWADPQDWTAKDANSLTLWFRGLSATFGSFVAGPPNWTLTARGTDITGTADEFFFAYKKFSGNGIITARVVSFTPITDDQAKAGVMMRSSLAPGAKYVMIAITPGWGAYFQRRITDDAGTDTTRQAGITAPRWVRLERNGNTFTTSYSDNGTTGWTTLGSVDMVLDVEVYVGLCLTSRDVGETCTGVFSNVTLPASATGQWVSGDIGILSNIAAPMYVMLQDSAGNSSPAISYTDPAATTIATFTQWNIPLTRFTGVNLKAVKKLIIGAGSRANTQAGGAGDLYIDDIGLIIPRK